MKYYFKDGMIAVAEVAYSVELTSTDIANQDKKYVPFTDEQTAFKEAYPEANAEEVTNLKLNN